ncbi:nickel-dependent hydrogenase large subunit [Arcobacter sp. FWKO B]|uniref:nickel-dependent hydrogenase large subunit n=1 Tax=Arcobacter sp. FWKO B TaxID=2593672 RepID=UPI0018A3FB0C|nr:nickel-dependent hydrogenase large subunit [Arcobacter sp. FWKO B]QOG12587.1 hydrogenase [Arcobacter sp. FWKO B]
MIELIEKIEGEAKLDFSFTNDLIDYVKIEFLSARGIENILKNRPALDSLVINPRVCGICGHAHLIATVQALESCYEKIEISDKAKIIRELTLNFELIQNHLKWFYLVLIPFFGKKQDTKKALYSSSLMTKAIAVLAGQYPHNSYAIVGGITSSVTNGDFIKVRSLIDEAILFFQSNLVDANIEEFWECDSVEHIFEKEGDLVDILMYIIYSNLNDMGKSYDRFIAFGGNSYFKKGKSNKTVVSTNLKYEYIKEKLIDYSYAKNVYYKDKSYEVGPLARGMINKVPLIKDAHRKYGDSIFSRILARVCEIAQLLYHSKQLLSMCNIKEPSYIKPKIDIKNITANGIGYVEAARGSLIHKVDLVDGIIKDYTIITPTQWNLGSGTKDNLGIAQNAMVGLSSVDEAKLVFKSFDVCSVCTTH